MDSPEKGSKPSGFQVRIENPDLLFKAIKDSASGEIGKALMESPIREIGVNLTSGKDTFDLSAEIDLDIFWARGPDKAPSVLTETVAGRFKLVSERGGNFVVEASKGTKLVFTKRGALGNIVVSTGEVEDFLGEKNRLVPPPRRQKRVLILLLKTSQKYSRKLSRSYMKLMGSFLLMRS